MVESASVAAEEIANFSFDGMQRLLEEDKEHIFLRNKFYLSIRSGGECYYLNVVAIHRNMHDTPTARARCGAFRHHLKAMTEKRAGNPNVQAGWFGTSRDGVRQIMNNGFGIYGMEKDCELGGFGVKISSESSAMDSVLSSTDDGDRLRHIVYCHMILGNVEEVPPGSRRYHPSSENFDSGADNLKSPRKYIIWYPDVNTHILPLYVLSIKLEPQIVNESVKKPSSPWISFQALQSMLSNSLPPSTMSLIRRLHTDFIERKISRLQLVLRVRQVTGDKLLVSAIKYFQDTQSETGKSSSNMHRRYDQGD